MDDAMSEHFAALRATVATLSLTYGEPVAVNYQSGGYVAYATWIDPTGSTLTWADLHHTVEDTPVNSDPLTLTATHMGNHVPEYADTDDYEGTITWWDNDGPDEYTAGVYYIYTPADNTTRVYGVGSTDS